MPFSQALDPIRSLKAAWKLLMQAPATVLVGGLLLWFLEGGATAISRMTFRMDGQQDLRHLGEAMQHTFDELRPYLVILLPLVTCLWFGFFALSSWIEVGFGRAIESGLRTGRDEVGKLFSGGERFGAMLLARLLCALIQFGIGLPMFVLAVVFIVFGRSAGGHELLLVLGLIAMGLVWTILAVYVGLGLFLTKPIVALESCRPSEALARSWKLASGNRLQLFLFVVLQFLLTMAGLCACCVGVLLSSPLVITMRYEAYLALTRGEQFPQWWIGSGKFPFEEPKAESYASPPVPPAVPPPLPPQG
jgi:hypothetical protein